MCGISGYNGKIAPSFDKIKLLGLLNTERGEDSFGICYNGFIHKDTGSYIKKINTIKFEESKKDYHTIISHNRRRSVGAVTVDNTHPFAIYKNEKKEEDRDPDMIFCHNGTIQNIKELADKYKVTYSYGKTDSEILGQIILDSGFSVLSEYHGGASLAFIMGEDLYLFNGASPKTQYMKDKEPERDLYYLKDHNKNIWFSSEKGHLDSVFLEDGIEAEQVPPNIILKFRKGRKIHSIEVDRKGYQTEPVVTKHTKHVTIGGAGGNRHKNDSIFENNSGELGEVFEKYGIYFNGECPLHGAYYINVIDKSLSTHEDIQAIKMYFYQGVLLKDREAYLECINQTTLKLKDGFYRKDSKDYWKRMVHPLSLIPTSFQRDLSSTVCEKLAIVGRSTDTSAYSFIPLFSNFEYRIENELIREYNCSFRTEANISDEENIEVIYYLWELFNVKEVFREFISVLARKELDEHDKAEAKLLSSSFRTDLEKSIFSIFDTELEEKELKKLSYNIIKLNEYFEDRFEESEIFEILKYSVDNG